MKQTFYFLCLLLLTINGIAQTVSPANSSPPIENKNSRSGNLLVAAGTAFKLSLQTPVSSRISEVGDQVIALLDETVRDNEDRIAIVRGTEFSGRVTQVQPAKIPQREAKITIVFERMRRPYGVEKIAVMITAIDDVANDRKFKAGDNEGKVGGGHSGERTLGNAGKGAQIGAIGGALGAIHGRKFGIFTGGVGVGVIAGVFLTKGNDIKLFPGTILRIRVERELTLPALEPDNTTALKATP